MLQRVISSSSSSLVRRARSGRRLILVGALYRRVSSSAFDMNSIISNGDSSSSNLILAKKMWRLNEGRSYEHCIELFESSELALDSEGTGGRAMSMDVHSVYAAMLAYSEAWQPWRVKELFDSFPSEAKNELSLCLLMHSYARADKLGSAERLMLAWTHLQLSRLPDDVVTSRFLKESYMMGSIGGGTQTGAAAARGAELASLAEAMLTTTGSGSLQNVIPLGAWISMLAIYSKRRAWRQCIDIINYLADFSAANGACYGLLEQSVTDGTETVECSRAVKHSLLDHLDELIVPSFMVAHEDILMNTLGSVGTVLRGGTTTVSTEGQFLQWNMLFHLTLRALSDSQQFNACTQLLALMRRSSVVTLSSEGQRRSIHRLSPQLPAIASLLQSFTASSADGIHVLTSDGIRHNRELLISLRGSVEDAVAAASSHKSCGGGRSHRVHSRVVSNLVREYLQALCRLDALDEADQFVSVVQRQAAAAPLRGSKWSRQEGLSSNEWLSPLLLRLKERGEWEKIEDLGELLLQGGERERRGGVNSSQRISMYDHTCEALRRAGQWERLAEVMSSYSRR